MKRIKITSQVTSPTTVWATREDSPEGGYVGDCLTYSFPTKFENGGVYDMAVLMLTWYKGNREFVNPLMRDIRRQLRRLGCEKVEAWTDKGDYRSEVWYDPNGYSAHDITRKLKAVAKILGWMPNAELSDWRNIMPGYWPKGVK